MARVLKHYIDMVLICSVLVCSGCAFGHKYNYHDALPTLNATGTGPIAVTTHDQRPYIERVAELS
jgi:hypothetical protein